MRKISVLLFLSIIVGVTCSVANAQAPDYWDSLIHLTERVEQHESKIQALEARVKVLEIISPGGTVGPAGVQ